MRDGSGLSVLSVGLRKIDPPLSRAGQGRFAIQASHSFDTMRTMFGRLRCPSRRRSSTVTNPSRAAVRIAF